MKKYTKITCTLFLSITLGALSSFGALQQHKKQDPLPSWNNTPIKKDIIEYIETISDKESKSYVPPVFRVATIDLDGTILCEMPVNFQRAIALKSLREQVQANEKLKNIQPYKAAWEMDEKFHNDSSNHNMIFLTAFKDFNMDDYHQFVSDYLKTDIAIGWNTSYQNLFYEPALDLIEYLIENDFEIYICSTTEEECIRVLLNQTFAIEPVSVLGNEVSLQYSMRNGKTTFTMTDQFRVPENRREGKCIHIKQTIGKDPIFCFGNSMGDYPMLMYAANSKYPSFVMVLTHDDGEREIMYKDSKLLDRAKENGWPVVSMKRDFKQLFKEGTAKEKSEKKNKNISRR